MTSERAPLRSAAAASGVAALSSRLASIVVVPFALKGLGADLYGIWVVATVIASSQGLVDLGARTALVRYTAMGSAEDDPAAILRTLRLVGLPYAALSVLFIAVTVPLTGRAVGWFDIGLGERDEAKLLLFSGIATFAMLNLQSIAVGLLTGLQKTMIAYLAITLGNVVYVSVAVGGYLLGSPVGAIVACGPAMLLAQILVLALPLRSALRDISAQARSSGPRTKVPVRELFSYSLGMQVVTLTDFAVLQLPRVLGAAALGAGAIVSLDIALRVGSVVAGVMIMSLPPVLPALSWEWTRGQTRAYAETALRVTRLVGLAGSVLVLGVALDGSSIVAYLAGDAAARPAWLLLVVVVAMATHALCGPLAAAAQARGDIRSIVAFKVSIGFVLAVSAMTLWPLSLEEIGATVAISLVIPSSVFFGSQLRRLVATGASGGSGWKVDATVLAVATALGLVAQRAAEWGELVSALIGAAALGAGATVVGMRMLRVGLITRPRLRNPA